MKSVLISIQPKWCALIESGEKTLEVRKARPKLDTTFKAYIYCTLSGSNELFREVLNADIAAWNRGKWGNKKGNVIGEFICDRIYYHTPDCLIVKEDREKATEGSCLSRNQLLAYLSGGKYVPGFKFPMSLLSDFYGWRISGLKIYDKPKALSTFCFPTERFCEPGLCSGCPKYEMPGEYGDVMWDCEWKRPIMRPPQNWCYVEELNV